MSDSMWAKYIVLVTITVASPLMVSCATAETPAISVSSTVVTSENRFESPAAPISQLATAGEHCFGKPLDVAAAAARIAAYYEQAIREYESARRVADAGRPLPSAGADMLGEVSDPDANNCVLVSTFRYNERYWWPPAQ